MRDMDFWRHLTQAMRGAQDGLPARWRQRGRIVSRGAA
jgi:hypothetical protein